MADKPHGDMKQVAAAGATGGATKMLASEVFLHEDTAEGGFRNMAPWILVAFVVHVALFLIVFPKFDYTVQKADRTRRVMTVRKYVPPPPPQQKKKKIVRKLTKKVPIPDPTPDEPEPIIEPEPEPEPEPIDPDVDLLIGVPEPPPATGPLMPGIGGVTEPELIRETRVEPEYPELARRARIEGKVILQVVVRKDGTIGDMTVFKEPAANLGFSEAALQAVEQWRYRPAMQNGRPVDVFITVVVTFALE